MPLFNWKLEDVKVTARYIYAFVYPSVFLNDLFFLDQINGLTLQDLSADLAKIQYRDTNSITVVQNRGKRDL